MFGKRCCHGGVERFDRRQDEPAGMRGERSGGLRREPGYAAEHERTGVR